MTIKRRTIRRERLNNGAMAGGGERRISAVILDGRVRRWVGIGWIDEGEPNARQRRTLPVVID